MFAPPAPAPDGATAGPAPPREEAPGAKHGNPSGASDTWRSIAACGASRPVQDHPGDPDRQVMATKPAAAGHLGAIHHQHHRQAQLPGQIGGGAAASGRRQHAPRRLSSPGGGQRLAYRRHRRRRGWCRAGKRHGVGIDVVGPDFTPYLVAGIHNRPVTVSAHRTGRVGSSPALSDQAGRAADRRGHEASAGRPRFSGPTPAPTASAMATSPAPVAAPRSHAQITASSGAGRRIASTRARGSSPSTVW